MECPVCFCTTGLVKLGCSHHMCKSCAETWYTKSPVDASCPMCREPLTWKGIHRLREKLEDEKAEVQLETCWETTAEEIFECTNYPWVMDDLDSAQRRFHAMKDHMDVNDLEWVLSIPYWWPPLDIIVYPEHLDNMLLQRFRLFVDNNRYSTAATAA